MAQYHFHHSLLVKLVTGQPNSRAQRNRLQLSEGEQHVYTEKKKLVAAISGDKLLQVNRGNNSQNEDARIRREPKRDLKACIQETSEYS